MWKDSDNCLLRQQQQRHAQRTTHSCAVAATAFPAVFHANSRPKCNFSNSPLAQAWNYIRRICTREQQPEPYPRLHNLNYSYYGGPTQHNFDDGPYESFAEVYTATITTAATAQLQLNCLQRKFGEFLRGINCYSLPLTTCNLIMLQQQQRYQQLYNSNTEISMMFASTLTGRDCKTPQLPTMISLNSLDAGLQRPPDKIVETAATKLSELINDTMSTLRSNLLTSIDDLMTVCLPSTSTPHCGAELFQVGSSSSSSQPAKQTKTAPVGQSASCDDIAFIEFFAQPTYCYFVIDICAHSLSDADAWPSDKSAAVPIPPAYEKSARLPRDDSSDANNNSLCKESPVSKCSPESTWPPGLTSSRRKRTISDCSDESYIYFLDEDEADDEDHDSVDEEDTEDADEEDEHDVSDDSDEEDECHVSSLRRPQGVKFTTADLGNDLKSVHFTNRHDSSNNGLAHRFSDNAYHQRIRAGAYSVAAAYHSAREACDKQQLHTAVTQAKKVHFNLKPMVHTIRAWDYAYRAARKSVWENFARDRERFRKRIERTGAYINPVLTPEHRSKVYERLFASNAQQQQQDAAG